jgi:hypothetical protein
MARIVPEPARQHRDTSMNRLHNLAKDFRVEAEKLKGKDRESIMPLVVRLESLHVEMIREFLSEVCEVVEHANSVNRHIREVENKLYGKKPESDPERNARIREMRSKGLTLGRIAINENTTVDAVRGVLRRTPKTISD